MFLGKFQSLDLSIKRRNKLQWTGIIKKNGGLRPYEQGCLPSRAAVQRLAGMLNEQGQQLKPFHPVECELGEMYAFDYEKMVRYIFKAFSLDKIAETESVELCITLDCAELTKT